MAEKGLLKYLNLESIVDKFADYFEKRMDLFKIQLMDEIAERSSKLVSAFILLSLMLIVVFLLNMTLALWLNHLLESEYLGFLILTGFYFLLFLVVYLMRSKITTWIYAAQMKAVQKNVTEKNENE